MTVLFFFSIQGKSYVVISDAFDATSFVAHPYHCTQPALLICWSQAYGLLSKTMRAA